ncbi:MAG: hypothetical protein KBC36_01170 [Spirochaetia bacterium]|nr:hypothetical protein [Spirochaetia bacterium]
MSAVAVQYESLATRNGFNSSVRHIKAVVSAVERVAGKENLADVLDELLAEKAIDSDEVLPAVSMMLGERFAYASQAANLDGTVPDPNLVAEAVGAWNAVDLVVVYHHPDLGVLALNPKNPAHMAKLERLARHELVVAYAGSYGKDSDKALAQKAAKALCELFAGGKPKVDAALLKGDCAWKAPKAVKATGGGRGPKTLAKPAPRKPGRPAKSAAASAKAAPLPPAAPPPKTLAEGPRPGARITPMYSVPVTNELFHNGNVEAWKRVIASYTARHPGLEVLVYYDGERITNLNALFKWGKVKHGSTIQFAVKGEEITDVPKLLRYLKQGASPMFEAFLRGPVNAVLMLF